MGSRLIDVVGIDGMDIAREGEGGECSFTHECRRQVRHPS